METLHDNIHPEEQIIKFGTDGLYRASTLEAFEAWARNPDRKYPLTIEVTNGSPTILNSSNEIAQKHAVYTSEIAKTGFVQFREAPRS